MEFIKVSSLFAVVYFRGEYMAKIIESANCVRRIIRLSVDDIISIVQDYQRTVPRFSKIDDVRSYLAEKVFYIPEDI